MPIVQSATGTFTGGTLTATLPGASSASNCVALIIAANTTVTTPASWTLRTSQVNNMGHYLFDRPGVSLTSVTVTAAAGNGTWAIFEITTGPYVTSSSANNVATGTTYNTPNLTPAAGTVEIIASLASLTPSAGTTRTLSGWTNSFVEFGDVCYPTGDAPMQGVASITVTANGSTAYSTTGTYSAASNDSRSAIIAAYTTTAAGAPAVPPFLVMAPRRP